MAPLVVGALFCGLWYFISYGALEPSRRFLLRPPHEVIAKGFLDWDVLSEMLVALWSTTRVAAYGLGISVVLATVIAVAMSQARLIERGLWPYLVTVQAVPILALVPLISFWAGTGQKARVIVCVVISFFPMIVNTLFGLQAVDRGAHDLFTLHHASRLLRLWKLMIPSALPAIFAGLRIAAGLSVIGAIVGDFFFGRGEIGIGQLMQRYFQRIRGEELVAAVILSSALGVAVFLLFTWLQNRIVGRWFEAVGGGGT